jgi:hypothetical protein
LTSVLEFHISWTIEMPAAIAAARRRRTNDAAMMR